MKFSIFVSIERYRPTDDMRAVAQQALELVKLAETGGFEIAWAAEHHTIELIIGPNPFTLLTHWAAHTSTIRLGTAVIVAPYWHPLRLAGEAALCDLLSGGRLEFGISRGAFQYEFDRMAGGIPQRQVSPMSKRSCRPSRRCGAEITSTMAPCGGFRVLLRFRSRCSSRIRRFGLLPAIPGPSNSLSNRAPISWQRRCPGLMPRSGFSASASAPRSPNFPVHDGRAF